MLHDIAVADCEVFDCAIMKVGDAIANIREPVDEPGPRKHIPEKFRSRLDSEQSSACFLSPPRRTDIGYEVPEVTGKPYSFKVRRGSTVEGRPGPKRPRRSIDIGPRESVNGLCLSSTKRLSDSRLSADALPILSNELSHTLIDGLPKVINLTEIANERFPTKHDIQVLGT